MELDPRKYSYVVRAQGDEYLATVSEFPHLTATHSDGPTEAISALMEKVFVELRWWLEEGDPAPRPQNPDVIVHAPDKNPRGFLWWDTMLWRNRRFGSDQVGFRQYLFHGTNSHNPSLCNCSGYTEESYVTFTHVGLRIAFSIPELFGMALDFLRVEFRLGLKGFEVPACTLSASTREGEVEIPPLEESARSLCAFMVLPEPVTLPPRTRFNAQVHVESDLRNQLEELERVLWIDDHADAFGEIRAFLYGRQRERDE